jgi:putative transposase
LQETGDIATRISLVRPRLKNLSVRRQCDLLSIKRSRIYYRPREEKPENIKMMTILDKHLAIHPTQGVESMVGLLKTMGHPVGPKRIRRLFRLMGHHTIYRRKNLTKMGLKQFIKPYLLRDMKITGPNQVWSTDITWVPMRKGFMYLTAIMDVYSRKIVGWGISNSLAAQWCRNVLEEAMQTHGRPQIINSDQGTQYTSTLWSQYLEKNNIEISMDGKGRATDNIWIERFWKSIKYDYIYLNPANDGFELYEGVQSHIAYYNNKIHQTTKQRPNDRYMEIKTTILNGIITPNLNLTS